MQSSSKPSQLVLGLALFSMFFGSGNLIFPLFLGQLAQSNWAVALGGFVLTAVCLPLLGLIAMVLYDGHYKRFFDLLGRPWGFLLTAILLIVWIPLGSGARCVSLSYSSLSAYVNMGSPWLYGALYSIATGFVVLQRGRLLSILGAYLTPALLLSLVAIFVSSMLSPFQFSQGPDAGPLFTQSVIEGYNTMDLIASFFFCASVIGLLKSQGGSAASNLKLVLQAGLIATVVLATVYAGLVFAAAVHAESLAPLQKEQMLAYLAKLTLGEHLGGIAAFSIFLACFTTSVALVNCFTEFLRDEVFKNSSSYYLSLGITLVACYLMSITGLEGITAVTSPALQICYPLLLLIIVWGVAKRSFELMKEKKCVDICEEHAAPSTTSIPVVD